MTEIKKVLEMVGFENLENWSPKKIILRDSREAILWVNKINGHGILDPDFWITEEEYREEYREEFSANLNSKTTPKDHLLVYDELNLRQQGQFSQHIKDNSDILEIGSSFGGVLKHTFNREIFNSYTAVEPNTEDASFIRSLIKGDLKNKLTVKNDFFGFDSEFVKKFDLIISFEVLEHIERPLEFIKNIYKNLKNGGKVNIEVPNHHDALLHVFKNKGYSNFYYHKAHIHYFTPTSLNDIFEKENFTGSVEGFQMYSSVNQFSWVYNNKPQKDGSTALNIYGDNDNENLDFKNLMVNFDNEWKKYVEEQLISDCLIYKGIK